MPRTVEFIDWHTSMQKMLPIPDGYRFKPQGRMQWLQRFAWWFLGKRHALEQAYEPMVKIERHRIDGDTFMERLFKQEESIVREFERNPKQLLIGSEDYAAMMSEKETRQYFHFEAKYYRNGSIRGMQIVVVPWMKGMGVMP
jgi:hypothetical protein